MEQTVQHNILHSMSTSPFNKISTNVLSYLFQFLDHNEVLLMSKINSKFKRALNAEYLWETKVLTDELFVPTDCDRCLFTSWKNYYLFINKLKKNVKGGKPNIGFKMRPMRGHSTYITAIACIEENVFDNKIISGDKQGNVLFWIVNEDGDFEGKTIHKSENEIINISIIGKDTLKDRLDDDLDKGLLVITEKNCLTHGK